MAITWNPSDKNASVTLSNGNLTASATSATGVGAYMVRATAAVGDGKWAFQYVFSALNDGVYDAVGLCNASASLSDNLGNNANGVGYYPQQELYGNGSSLTNGAGTTTFPLLSAGTVATFAWYKSGSTVLVWVRAGSGNWNNDALADPATLTRGVSVGGFLTGNLFAAFVVGQNSAGTTTATADFDGPFTLPSGFSYYDPGGGGGTDYPVSWTPGAVAAALASSQTRNRQASSTMALSTALGRIAKGDRLGSVTYGAAGSVQYFAFVGATAAIPLGAGGGVGGVGAESVTSSGALVADGGVSGASVRGAKADGSLGASGGLTSSLQTGAARNVTLGAVGGMASSLQVGAALSWTLTATGDLSSAVRAARSGAVVFTGSGDMDFTAGGNLVSWSLLASAALAGATRTAAQGAAAMVVASAVAGTPAASRDASGSLGAAAGMSVVAVVGKVVSAALGAVASLAPVTVAARSVSGFLGALANLLGVGEGGGKSVVTPPCRTVYACPQNRVVEAQAQDRTVYARDC